MRAAAGHHAVYIPNLRYYHFAGFDSFIQGEKAARVRALAGDHGKYSEVSVRNRRQQLVISQHRCWF